MTPAIVADRFNLADYLLFDRQREGLGSKVCLRFGKYSYTYDDVAQRARAFAVALERADVRRGERVLVALPDVPAFAWTLLGALARGCVVAMGSPEAPIESLEQLLVYARSAALVTTPNLAARLRDRKRIVRDELRRIWCVAEAGALSGEDDPEADTGEDDWSVSLSRVMTPVDDVPVPVTTHRDEPAIWLFTSGSTGAPRAAMHTHGDIAFHTEAYAKQTVRFRSEDLTISIPRLHFGYATGTNLFFPFAVGATVCLFSERPNPESIAQAIALYRPTIVTNVPTMLSRLLDHDQHSRALGGPGLDLSCVRFSISAGEALAESILRRWTDRFRSDVYDGIGSAEMFHIYATNRPGDVKPGSVGKVVDGYEIRILPREAEDPGAPPLGPGETGMLWVRGGSVGHGYWLDRAKTLQVFRGSWCRTGDLFHVDRDGYLYFAGRADDLLKVSGCWVAPVEVERCLMAHRAVLHAAVIGVKKAGLMTTKAFVRLRDGYAATHEMAAELRLFAAARLGKQKAPRLVEFVDELPKTDRGKVDRESLRIRP